MLEIETAFPAISMVAGGWLKAEWTPHYFELLRLTSTQAYGHVSPLSSAVDAHLRNHQRMAAVYARPKSIPGSMGEAMAAAI
jgi:hypothetical protein